MPTQARWRPPHSPTVRNGRFIQHCHAFAAALAEGRLADANARLPGRDDPSAREAVSWHFVKSTVMVVILHDVKSSKTAVPDSRVIGVGPCDVQL
jgi:hypothetical protein